MKKAAIWLRAERNKDATNRSFIEVRQSGRHYEGASQDCRWKAPCDNSFLLVPSPMVLIEGYQIANTT